LLWVWIGSLIQTSRGARQVEGSTAAIIFVGILATYVIILMVAGAIEARNRAAEDQAPVRYPWNRSMRDEPYRPGTQKLSPIETVFVGTAVVATIAMMIWFFAFAGNPLPT
jgi:amino acid transporter